MSFARALDAEIRKHRRGASTWLVLGAAAFTPAVIAVVRTLRPDGVAELHARADFWTILWRDAWESVAVFFLPLAAMLAASVATQVEHRANAWKQIHATSLAPHDVYFAKLAVPVAMLYATALGFQLALYASPLLPAILVAGVAFPAATPPIVSHALDALRYATDALPIVAIQYAIALRTPNAVVPLGIGFLAWIAALAAIGWEGRWANPYGYVTYDHLAKATDERMLAPTLALAVFAAACAAGYASFVLRARKG